MSFDTHINLWKIELQSDPTQSKIRKINLDFGSWISDLGFCNIITWHRELLASRRLGSADLLGGPGIIFRGGSKRKPPWLGEKVHLQVFVLHFQDVAKHVRLEALANSMAEEATHEVRQDLVQFGFVVFRSLVLGMS